MYLSFIQKFKAGFKWNPSESGRCQQLNTSKWDVFALDGQKTWDRDGVRITQATYIEGMAWGLVRLEPSQVRTANGDEGGELSCGHACWPSVWWSALILSRQGEAAKFSELGMGMRYGHHYTFMRVVRRQFGRNMEDNCHGKKMEACDQRRDYTGPDSGWNVRVIVRKEDITIIILKQRWKRPGLMR